MLVLNMKESLHHFPASIYVRVMAFAKAFREAPRGCEYSLHQAQAGDGEASLGIKIEGGMHVFTIPEALEFATVIEKYVGFNPDDPMNPDIKILVAGIREACKTMAN